MHIVRFSYNKKYSWGVLQGNRIRILSQAPYNRIHFTGREVLLSKVKLLAPVVPSKIVLVGLNYRDHAHELKMALPSEPIIFLKPTTTIIGPQSEIQYPDGVTRLDYEAELAFVIKKKARNIGPDDANDFIFGFTCLNDVTARDLQQKDVQWTRAKSFDTFCPVGPWINTDFNPANKKIQAFLNGICKQDSSTKQLLFTIPQLISFISGIMTLYPGDIISTGTPFGVGPMKKGDRIEIRIQGLGSLKNRIT